MDEQKIKLLIKLYFIAKDLWYICSVNKTPKQHCQVRPSLFKVSEVLYSTCIEELFEKDKQQRRHYSCCFKIIL